MVGYGFDIPFGALMQKTLNLKLHSDLGFKTLLPKTVQAGRAVSSAAEFVWSSLFHSQLRIQIEPGVTKEARNEGLDRVHERFGRYLM